MSIPNQPDNSTKSLLAATIITILLLLGGTVLVTVGTSVAFGVPVGLTVLGFLLVVFGLIVGFRS